MNQELSKVQDIFRDILDTTSLVINEKSTPDTVEGWDSIANVNIIMAVEEDFGVKFDVQDLQNIKSVGDILTLIQKKK